MANYFIHIPRTGGTSLMESLPKDSCGYLGHDLRARGYRHPSRCCTAADFAFAFVRDPFERLASAYYYLRAGGASGLDNFDAYLLGLRTQSLDEFIVRGLESAATWQMHFVPQAFFLRDVPKVRLYLSTHRLAAFDEICQRLGVTPPGPFLELNVSERRSAGVRFDARTEAIVREVYRDDFLLLERFAR